MTGVSPADGPLSHSAPRSATAGWQIGGYARPIQVSNLPNLVGGRGERRHCLPQAQGHRRAAPRWRRGSGYPILDDPISDPLGELHHAQVMGSGRLRSRVLSLNAQLVESCRGRLTDQDIGSTDRYLCAGRHPRDHQGGGVVKAKFTFKSDVTIMAWRNHDLM